MSYETEKKRYRELLASGHKPSEALHIIESEKSQGMHDIPKQEPVKEEVRVSASAPKEPSRWSKLGAGIGKAASKLLGGRGYNEDPVRFKNSGRFKHQQPKEKIVYVDASGRPIQKKKQTRRVVYVREREAPISPFASDFQSGGGGFSSDIGGNPFASDIERSRKKRK